MEGGENEGEVLREPGPEGGDVGEDVSSCAFGEEAVVGGYQDGGVLEGEVDYPGKMDVSQLRQSTGGLRLSIMVEAKGECD